MTGHANILLLEKLINLQSEYIEFLGKHETNGAIFMATHGITVDREEVEKGAKLREEISKLKREILPL